MEIKNNEELRKALMGIMPVSNDTVIKFVPEVYKLLEIPEENQPLVSMTAWTNEQAIVVKQSHYDSKNKTKAKSKKVEDTKSTYISHIVDNVVDIENLVDVSTEELKPIIYEGAKTLEILPESIVFYIWAELVRLSGLQLG